MLNRITRCLFIGSALFTATACSSMHKEPAAAQPGVQVQFPVNWKVEKDGRTTASGPDGVAVIVMRIDKKSPDEVMKAVPQNLSPVIQKMSIDNTEDTTVNGLKAERVVGRGQRNDRPVRFNALLIGAKDRAATDAVIAVGPETQYKQHMLELDNALDSVKAGE